MKFCSLIASNPQVYVDTGHVSVEEAVRLVDLKERYGYSNVIVSSSVTKIAPIETFEGIGGQRRVNRVFFLPRIPRPPPFH